VALEVELPVEELRSPEEKGPSDHTGMVSNRGALAKTRRRRIMTQNRILMVGKDGNSTKA
jgi:hypothetical protein